MGKQLGLNLHQGSCGGRRPYSGRKRIRNKGVAHRTREQVTKRTPLHITLKYKTMIKNKTCLKILKRAILNARSHGLKIIHFSMQSNHFHFIIEAEDNAVLTKGMRSLAVTFAKGLQKGRVQMERYHLHVLKTLRETRNAVQYALFNQQKHEKGTYSEIDEYSSLLSLSNALKVIQNYAKTNKVTLKIGKKEDWDLDREKSYLLRRALQRLCS